MYRQVPDVALISNIVNSDSISLVDKSQKLMQLIRSCRLLLPKDYVINQFVNQLPRKITIDKKKAIETNLTSEAFSSEVFVIPAYSFGPFNPESYFKKGMKILWLLKEPYCENISEIDGSAPREEDFYNQQKNYQNWEDFSYLNNAIVKLVKHTKTLLSKLLQKDICEDEVMEHVCVLEMNHFPGLSIYKDPDLKEQSQKKYKQSDDLKISEWLTDNSEILTHLINFYEPNIVIGHSGCMTKLGKILDDKGVEDNSYDLFNWLKCHTIGHLTNLKYNVQVLNRVILKTDNMQLDKSGVSFSIDDRNCLWVGWYHPSASQYGDGRWDKITDKIMQIV